MLCTVNPSYITNMRIIFLFGWVLLIVAFLAAALEGVGLVYGEPNTFWVSANDLWHTVFPADYVIFKNQIIGISPFLWDPVLEVLLWPPAWFLFTVPGVLLTWHFRPNKELRPDQLEEVKRQSESLFLVDELTHAAKHDEDYDHLEDDRMPRHFVVEEVYDRDHLEELDNIDGQFPTTVEALDAMDLVHAETEHPDASDENEVKTIPPVFGPLPPPKVRNDLTNNKDET